MTDDDWEQAVEEARQQRMREIAADVHREISVIDEFVQSVIAERSFIGPRPGEGCARMISDFAFESSTWDGESVRVVCPTCGWWVQMDGVVRRGLVSCDRQGLLT